MHMQKVGEAFVSASHLFHFHDIRLWFSGRVYTPSVRSMLPRDSETWPLTTEDVSILSVFEHRSLSSAGRMWWANCFSDSKVRPKQPDHTVTSLHETLKVNRLTWLVHVLIAAAQRPPSWIRLSFEQIMVKWDEVASRYHAQSIWIT